MIGNMLFPGIGGIVGGIGGGLLGGLFGDDPEYPQPTYFIDPNSPEAGRLRDYTMAGIDNAVANPYTINFKGNSWQRVGLKDAYHLGMLSKNLTSPTGSTGGDPGNNIGGALLNAGGMAGMLGNNLGLSEAGAAMKVTGPQYDPTEALQPGGATRSVQNPNRNVPWDPTENLNRWPF